VDEALNSWFAREILVHEGALVRYLRRAWPNQDEVLDLRQEVYIRVYEAAKSTRPTFAKTFLFTAARHLMTDRARHARVVSIESVGNCDDLNVLVDEISPERRLHARQELKQLGIAFGLLPPRCREVVWLRKVEGFSQGEVAERLGISVRTVEFQVQKGMRVLAHALFGNDHEQQGNAASGAADRESGDAIG